MRESEDLNSVQRGDGKGEWTEEGVAVEDEGFETGEWGEVRDGTGERVVLEVDDSELVEVSERVGWEDAAEAGVGECQSKDSALNTPHALPLAVVEALVEGEEEPVV